MKLRTSSFNRTVFQKDLARFAPCWAGYLIILLLCVVNMMDRGQAYYRIGNVGDSIVLMAWMNLFYGAVVAQLLFGDLYNARLCNALHAMPMTREGWFLTHTAAGLCFSVLPNLVVVLVGLPLLNLGVGWTAALWWLLACTMQYLFFFGVAVLCVMATGNRLGQIALYAVVNFAGLLAYWLMHSFYEPLLHGILIDEMPFYTLCPVGKFSQFSDCLIIDYERIENEMGDFIGYNVFGVAPGEGWGYGAICAVLGVGALALALVLYRKRRLECAGDFVAFSQLEPVAAVVATLFCGSFASLFGDAFGINMKYTLLVAGMVVGYFACRMLLERSTRVFRKKTFLGCGAIMAVFALTMVLTWLDPAGLTRYIPEIDEVESVTFSESYTLHNHNDYPFEATEIADIQALMEVHADGITREASSQPGGTEEVYSTFTVRLEYKLKNGRTVNRFYDIHPNSGAGQILKGYLTRPECVLGFPAEEAYEMIPYIHTIYVDGMPDPEYGLKALDLEGLMDAILADCAAGNMAQLRGYHYPTNYDQLGREYGYYDMGVCYLEFGWDHEKLETALQGKTNSYGIISYSSIRVFQSCTNTLKWIEDNGLMTEEFKSQMYEKFGGAYAEFAIPTGN